MRVWTVQTIHHGRDTTKVKKEGGAGAVMWPNPGVDDAAFRRTLPVRLADKSRTPLRLIFRSIDLASLPHFRIPS